MKLKIKNFFHDNTNGDDLGYSQGSVERQIRFHSFLPEKEEKATKGRIIGIYKIIGTQAFIKCNIFIKNLEHKILETLEMKRIQNHILYVKEKLWQNTSRPLKYLARMFKEKKLSKFITVSRNVSGKKLPISKDIAYFFTIY